MRKVAVFMFAWWFIAGGVSYDYAGRQYGPFSDEADCNEIAAQQEKRLKSMTSMPNFLYVSKCWKG